jgi:hypothetical protein
MDGWEIALWIAAGYAAVVPLVRMMVTKREGLLVKFRAQMAGEKRRRKEKEKSGSRSRAA